MSLWQVLARLRAVFVDIPFRKAFFLVLFACFVLLVQSVYGLGAASSKIMTNDLIEQFKHLAQSGELSQRLKANATFNVSCWTMGGRLCWDTVEANGWKLQFNIFSGWWRILDSENTRVARGTSLEQLRNLLEDRPTSLFPNYADDGYRFSHFAPKVKTGRTVVLIHGWGVRAISMQDLARRLALEGYDVYNYDYPTSKKEIASHVELFLSKFRELAGNLPADEKLYVLTHSMGGILLRGALAQMTDEECRRITAIVMLGPPNRGSRLAYPGKLAPVRWFNPSLGDMAPDDDSYVMNIPAPAWLPPVGIIAGKYDGKVSIEASHLPDGMPHHHVVVPCTHPGLRKPDNVIRHVLDFFEKRQFG